MTRHPDDGRPYRVYAEAAEELGGESFHVRVQTTDLYIRADFPHDRHWHSAVIAFSDGSTQPIEIKKAAGKQSFTFTKRTVTWARMTKLVQAEPLGWCAWVELEFWGTEAGR